MALSKTSRDHDEIRKWAEARGAVPAEVKGTDHNGEPGILRFEFPNAPNHNDGKLEQISWDEFFDKFDERNLELVYQEHTAEGAQSNFNKLVCPENDNVAHRKENHSSSKSSQSSKTHSSGSSSHSGSKGHSGSGKSSSSSHSKSHKAA